MAKSASSRKKSTSKRKSSRKSARAGSLNSALKSFKPGVFLKRWNRELSGGFLLAAAGVSIYSLFFSAEGWLASNWYSMLGFVFGWLKYTIPFVLLIGGVLVLVPAARKKLPEISMEQKFGIGMFIPFVFILGNIMARAGSLEEGLAASRLGIGGGVIGTYLLGGLVHGLGKPGATVVLVSWVVAAGMLAFRISLADLAGWIAGGVQWIWKQVQGSGGKKESVSVPLSQVPQTIHTEDAADTESMDQPVEQTAAGLQLQNQAVENPESVKREWKLPPIEEILEPGTESRFDVNHSQKRARLIEETLESFGAPANIVEINHGPTITQFGVEPAFVESRGGRRIKVKVSKIVSLADDLALALAAPSVRVQAPVPGKGFVGIEVPNPEISLVALEAVITSRQSKKIRSPLRIGLGQDVAGNPVSTDLADMPHLLIAGTTGSGKSVCVNTIIASLLLQNTPNDLRFVMIDPKRVELTFYNGIPHLLSPVLTNLERVVPTLQWVQREMDQRYQDFSKEGVRNLEDFNKRMKQTNRTGKPYLVVVIDELADLMMMAPDETERVITRLAQLSRATGIHLVIATQRPSTDVVTGVIKANFPARIAFAVASTIDSRVILDQPGAERLLGKGDMLFHPPDAPAPIRMQGAFVSDKELERLTRYWKNQALGGERTQPIQVPEQTIPADAKLQQAPLWEGMASTDDPDDDHDDIYDVAVDAVRSARRASISMLQRKLRIGYTRAARLIDTMEEEGIIGPAKGGSHAREILDYGEPIIKEKPFEESS